MYHLYNGLLLLLSPLILLGFAYRRWVLKKGEGWGERLGFLTSPPFADRPLWFHAASAGEVASIAPLLRVLRQQASSQEIVLSVLTPAGKEMAHRLCPDLSYVFYAPLDIPQVVRRVIRRLNPSLLILVEAEIWPNLLAVAQKEGIPTALISARISDKGYQRAKYLRPLLRWALGHLDFIGAGFEQDAERLRRMGAPPERVKVMGSLKFAQQEPPLREQEALRLRQEWGIPTDCYVIVAGSTRPGEEEILCRALKRVLQEIPNILMILAPRHLERVEEVRAIIEKSGFRPELRTEYQKPLLPEKRVILLLNTIGELSRVYALADVAFVGGTLVPIGGHNLLQAVAQGKPVLFGPYTQNVREVAQKLEELQLGFCVKDDQELALRILELLRSESYRKDLRERALSFLEPHQKVIKDYLQVIQSLSSSQRH